MNTGREVSVRPLRTRPLWVLVALGAAGAVLAAGRLVHTGELLDWWVGGGLPAALIGVAFLHAVTLEVGADAYGVRYGSLVRRRRSLPWGDIADLRVHIQYGRTPSPCTGWRGRARLAQQPGPTSASTSSMGEP
ncbi:PH domain-containing protein [Streptomyces tendae]|uniref:PH domain-containing protein n=1 Tax=Streptomyces tendae TaxID=1932 RepID=UPI0036CFD2AE